jgi:hypothetical protein
VGAAVTGLTTLLTALTTGDQHVSAAEWVATLIATLIAYGAVWKTSNQPADDRGDSFVTVLWVACLLAVTIAASIFIYHHLR